MPTNEHENFNLKEILNGHKANVLKNIHQKINNCIQNKQISRHLILDNSTKSKFALNLEKPVKMCFYFDNG